MPPFFLSCLATSDIIDFIGIAVNAILAVWIVRTLQNNLTNRRYLKDHLINEVKELRTEYKKFLNDLHGGKIKPKQALSWFKLMNIKTQDTMSILYDKYGIDLYFLKPYQVDLRELVTEQDIFNVNFRDNKFLVLDDISLRQIISFQQDNSSKFNQLIIAINDKK